VPTALRIAGFALFACLALSILGGLHFYLAQRLVLDAALAPGLERGLVIALAALAGLIVTLPLVERLFSMRPARWIAWPATLWMGLMFLLFVGVAVSDLALWATGTPALAGDGDPAALVPAARGRALLVAGVAFGAGGFALAGALRGPRVVRREIELARWPAALDGFRIAQISDVHIGILLDRRFARSVTDQCNALAADLIAVTGDLVDGPVERLRDEVEPFAELRARHGVYFVTGNHDHYSGAPGWVEVVRKLGMCVLRNERLSIERDGASFDLAGVDDHQGTFEEGWREDLDQALEGRDPERAVVLLAHDPRTFKKARRMGVDLQLSGHTHGGQIWPFRYFVRLATRWVAGLYREGDAQLYVSRGTGFWGPPMRLFAPAEITEIVIRRGGEHGV